jgi:phage terminase large subunit
MELENEMITVLSKIGIQIEKLDNAKGLFIEREQLLSDKKYDEVKKLIPQLKQTYSSSFLTSLQKDADKTQKWPLLNLVRQMFSIHGFKMEPIRKSNGYTLEGIKKYKRFFLIREKNNCSSLIKNQEIKKIDFKNADETNDI